MRLQAQGIKFTSKNIVSYVDIVALSNCICYLGKPLNYVIILCPKATIQRCSAKIAAQPVMLPKKVISKVSQS